MITGTLGDTTHLRKIYRMLIIVPLCQNSFDHNNLRTAGGRTSKLWRSSNFRCCNILSSIAKINQTVKKLQFEVLNHSVIKLFPSGKKKVRYDFDTAIQDNRFRFSSFFFLDPTKSEAKFLSFRRHSRKYPVHVCVCVFLKYKPAKF